LLKKEGGREREEEERKEGVQKGRQARYPSGRLIRKAHLIVRVTETARAKSFQVCYKI